MPPPPPPFPTAADHNFIPKDLRPITITRYAPPPHNFDSLYAPFPSMWASSARPFAVSPAPPPPPSDEEVPAGMKVKLLCGCGGRILPRPSDGALRYVGGQTRIVSVRRDVGFREFMAKMAEVYGPAPAVKYQLPDEDLDALVSVSCAEDLANMMEEYDKLADSSPDGSAKLRVFIFSGAAGEFDPAAAQFDAVDSSQRYMDAVNGVVEAANPGIFRPVSAVAVAGSAKDRTGSAASSANSEVNAEVDGASSTQVESEAPAPPPQTVMVPQDGCRVLYYPVGVPLENTTDYSMPYMNPYGVVYPRNPPQATFSGTVYSDNINGHSMLAPSMPQASSSPRAGLQSNGVPTTVQAAPYVLVSTQGLPGTVNSRPPLPPQVVVQEPLVKLDECNMCQKQLPHAHSDSILQEPVNVISKTISEPNQLFQSHLADEDGRFSNQLRVVVTGGMSDDGLNNLGYQGAAAATQPRLVPHSEPVTVQEVIPQSLPLGLMPSNGVPVRTAPLDQVHGMIHSGSSNDLIRPVDAKFEALHVNPPEVVDQYRSNLLRPEIAASIGVVPETLMVNGGARLVEHPAPVSGAGAFGVQPTVISDGIYARPVDLRPHNLEVPANLHNYQLVKPNNNISPTLVNPEVSGNVRVDFVPLVPGFESTQLPGEMIPARVVSDAPSFPVVTPPISAPAVFPGLVGQNWNPAASNTLFSNQDPWNLIQQTQQSHLPPPRPIKVVGNNPFAERDPVNEAYIMTNVSEMTPKTGVEESQISQPTERSNQGLVEEQIKQDLKAVAEGVAASVLQTSMNSCALSSRHHSSQLDNQSNRSRDTPQDNDELHNQDLKSKKQLDKAIYGLNITEDISRLQIIKSCDLEELRELGSGTFGTVYHGKWKGTDVAIKRINDRCFAGKPSEQERLRADFWNEACKLADLHHPNVVAFYGVVLDGPAESVATVTEYMVNGSLRHALQRNDRSLDRRKRLLIAMDVAFGMEYLHEKNIVHFDLKSDNLLVNLRDSHRPICKVGDLGLSKVKCQTLISGGVRGTLPWMAPELLNGSSSLVSEKVDVFSFGIVMWELLTGEEPYGDLHYGAIIGGIVNNTLRPPVPETCDPEWKSLMEQCWASEPCERPCFPEIASRLRAMAASLPPKEKPSTVKNEVKGP